MYDDRDTAPHRVRAIIAAEKKERRERERKMKVYVWQAADITIISFGTRSRVARKLLQSSRQLTDDELDLLEKPHTFVAFLGEPIIFDNPHGAKPSEGETMKNTPPAESR